MGPKMVSGWGYLYRNNKYLFLIVLGMLVFRGAVADWYTVPTGSMKPTILEGDRIFVDKLAYDLNMPFSTVSLMKHGDPKRNDIIIFESASAGKRLVKRVIGLPGDHVVLRDNRLFINGNAADYRVASPALMQPLSRKDRESSVIVREKIQNDDHTVMLTPSTNTYFSNFGPVTVPNNHYLVLGDNRDNSADSRVFGFVPRSEITGRAKSVIMSLNDKNYHLPRRERFFYPLQ